MTVAVHPRALAVPSASRERNRRRPRRRLIDGSDAHAQANGGGRAESGDGGRAGGPGGVHIVQRQFVEFELECRVEFELQFASGRRCPGGRNRDRRDQRPGLLRRRARAGARRCGRSGRRPSGDLDGQHLAAAQGRLGREDRRRQRGGRQGARHGRGADRIRGGSAGLRQRVEGIGKQPLVHLASGEQRVRQCFGPAARLRHRAQRDVELAGCQPAGGGPGRAGGQCEVLHRAVSAAAGQGHRDQRHHGHRE